jgi:hypothetical protein
MNSNFRVHFERRESLRIASRGTSRYGTGNQRLLQAQGRSLDDTAGSSRARHTIRVIACALPHDTAISN